MTRTANRFEKGSGVYACRCCKRNTRSTGRGDNELVKLCAECYDLAGEENHLSDNSKFYSKPEQVIELISWVAGKGGDASCWDELKAEAEKQIAAAKPADAGFEPADDPDAWKKLDDKLLADAKVKKDAELAQAPAVQANRVYVVVSRERGFIYGITQNIETARRLLNEALARTPSEIISISDEPILK